VDEVVELMSMRAFRQGLSLTATCTPDTPATILSDPVRFRQIVTNLVSNAIKFTERGSIKAHLSSVRRPDGAIELRLSVEDTGCGIAPDQLPRLFDSFWQGDASTTRRFGGAGLGLRISKSLAELLGGDIQVRTEPGRGSLFAASIIAACVSDEPPSDAAPPAPVPADKGALEHIRILLAEDGPDNQRLLTHHLTRAGAIVRVVEHGRAAVDAILDPGVAQGAPMTPDLIIMDMQMPEMDGYTATRTLREHGVRVPVLALTAHAMQHDRQRCLDAGCDDYASKPIDRATLLAVCRRLIRDGESQPAPLPCPHA
jgi:CheY-like chemotaxis protein